MNKILSKLNSLIEESEKLLSQQNISNEEIAVYRKKAATLFIFLINKNLDDTINEIAERGLKYKVKKIKNPFFRWIYYQLTTARDDITFEAPYLKGHSELDYIKQYIFWTKMTLEGIITSLNHAIFNDKDLNE